ncbi:hypothetical protein [Ferirhizobium litorale]|uniref:Phage tail protein n=1 Tax=Ferirhizobium litorale TaxID=2927786 RepID=A0AAE3QG85_9HYPH|nr:hypothetical protein [Fererhizobium litorale]MDI7924610.1 hypothetical protein [Fererhizobium litorale]
MSDYPLVTVNDLPPIEELLGTDVLLPFRGAAAGRSTLAVLLAYIKGNVEVPDSVQAAIDNLIGGAPEALDTLYEIAAALNDDANLAATLTAAIALKLDKAGGALTGNLDLGGNRIINALLDSGVAVSDPASPTKKARFSVSGVTAGNTRVITVPDRDVDLGRQWEVLANESVSAGPSWSLNNLSAFRMLRVSGYIRPSNDAVGISLHVSSDNGATWAAGASDYAFQSATFDDVAASVSRSSATTSMLVSGAAGNLTTEGASFDILIHNFNQALYSRFQIESHYQDASGNDIARKIAGRRFSAAADNALRLTASSGNIAAGYICVQGLRG